MDVLYSPVSSETGWKCLFIECGPLLKMKISAGMSNITEVCWVTRVVASFKKWLTSWCGCHSFQNFEYLPAVAIVFSLLLHCVARCTEIRFEMEWILKNIGSRISHHFLRLHRSQWGGLEGWFAIYNLLMIWHFYCFLFVFLLELTDTKAAIPEVYSIGVGVLDCLVIKL